MKNCFTRNKIILLEGDKMAKLTVGELREFIADVPEDTEVRIASLYNTLTEEHYHVSTDDISCSIDAEGSFLVLVPLEIEVSDDAGL